jgi:hypothetical protein
MGVNGMLLQILSHMFACQGVNEMLLHILSHMLSQIFLNVFLQMALRMVFADIACVANHLSRRLRKAGHPYAPTSYSRFSQVQSTRGRHVHNVSHWGETSEASRQWRS